MATKKVTRLSSKDLLLELDKIVKPLQGMQQHVARVRRALDDMRQKQEAFLLDLRRRVEALEQARAQKVPAWAARPGRKGR
jgi:hypothetical protein